MAERTTIDDLLTGARRRLRRLSPAQAHAAAAAGARLVDIRSEAQRAADGAVPGAIAHPRNVLEWRVDPSSGHGDPALGGAPDQPLILLCDEGYQSSLAAATLLDLGFTGATDVDGGFRAWRAAGLPVKAPLGRYARMERERRWLLGGVPAGAGDGHAIEDRYLDGTRMRLRRMTPAAGGPPVLKLGRKQPRGPGEHAVTTMYLSPAEFAVLAALPARVLRKRRLRLLHAGLTYAVDVFEGALAGLVLAEIELAPGAPAAAAPPLAIRDVTDDPRCAGAALAGQGSADLAALAAGR